MNDNTLIAWTRTEINRKSHDPNCTGILEAKAELWLEGSYTGCTTGNVYGDSIGRDSLANHRVEAERYCTVYLCGPYRAKGRHIFNGSIFRSSLGNNTWAGSCGGGGGGTCNPCTLGHVEGTQCWPTQQDECGCCPDPCPLVVDRSGDGLHFSSAEDGALLDINGRRAMLWLGWPTSGDDAWLALDRNGDGQIGDGSELFGNTRRLASGRNAENGYEVLAELDENNDGVVDGRDPAFAKLVLWADADRNGVSEPRELIPLASVGIRALSVEYRDTEKRDRWGNRLRFEALDGSSVDVFPVWQSPDSADPGAGASR